jgi:ATP-binding cassette, subfamily B, bacterial
VLDGGRVIDQGTHDQLVAKGGRYAELAKLQFRLDDMG